MPASRRESSDETNFIVRVPSDDHQRAAVFEGRNESVSEV